VFPDCGDQAIAVGDNTILPVKEASG